MSNLIKNQRASKAATMVNEIKKQISLSDRVAKAMMAVEREHFVPRGMIMSAYRLDALPLNSKQFISSPLTVAKMTTYLMAEGCDSILEIGCGSGYQAAVLSKLARRVLSIERIEKLLKEAKENFKKAEIFNILTKLDDGQNGWAEYAPFDRIIFSATAQKIPIELLDQLEVGGVMVFPLLHENKQFITRIIKTESGYKKEELEECEFVPVLSGIDKS
ncbi:MAG: protein-L-isoaspartate(D-aspartate) O-methyltransferase [Campylobacterota bacterium]|nr:protein-L-isoaspartate(D-aspartate) O-methyltransferase [Campylobacterota bacterium]